MFQGIEYQGRLVRRDGRPASPGNYQIRFSLHADATTRRSSWTEEHHDVVVADLGFFSVILGLSSPLKASYFKTGPRWLSTRMVRRGEVADEVGPRAPLSGLVVTMAEMIEKIEKRLARVEEIYATIKSRPSTVELLDRIQELEGRVVALDQAELPQIGRSIGALSRRLDHIDGEDGRLECLTDRVDEIDGPDGDIIDLNARMDHMENHSP